MVIAARHLVWVGGLCLCLRAATGASGDTDSRRLQMGSELLPRVLSVDLDVEKKISGSTCLLLLVYERDRESAEAYAMALRRSVSTVRGRPVVVSIAQVSELSQQNRVPAALMIVEPLGRSAFAPARAYAEEQQRLLFSPFDGDVERGASAGVYIGARILLHFNVRELRRCAVRIEPEVLRISKRYE